jgi:hypothetical protein
MWSAETDSDSSVPPAGTVASDTVLPGPGCDGLQVDGRSFSETTVLEAA